MRTSSNSLLLGKDEDKAYISEPYKRFSCGNLQRVKGKEFVVYEHCLTHSLSRYRLRLNVIEKKLKRSLLGSGSRTAVKINDD